MYLPVLCGGWLTQTFVHLAYPPDQVQRLLPEVLAVDTHERWAWVSLTPFVMAGVRPPGLPAALPSFEETNLRTYVHGPDGRDGLWFLSIDVNCAVMLAARTVGAPYHLAQLTLSRGGDVLTYIGSRERGGPRYRVVARPGEPVRPTRRDVWLTSRWRAYTRRSGVLWQTPVEHEPWPLRAARLEGFEETLTLAAGLPPPAQEPLVHFSHGVRSALASPARCGRLRGGRDEPGAGSAGPGAVQLVGGGWPLLHLRSFEWVFGTKSEDWLQRTTAGLLGTAGWSMLFTPATPGTARQARRTGLGTAVTLLTVDLVYVPMGRIRPTYLLDAAMQAGWLLAWRRCGRLGPGAGA